MDSEFGAVSAARQTDAGASLPGQLASLLHPPLAVLCLNERADEAGITPYMANQNAIDTGSRGGSATPSPGVVKYRKSADAACPRTGRHAVFRPEHHADAGIVTVTSSVSERIFSDLPGCTSLPRQHSLATSLPMLSIAHEIDSSAQILATSSPASSRSADMWPVLCMDASN
jgi:hypothetical protein